VAEAGLDCRVLPGITKDQWIAEVARRLGDPRIKIELINESDDPVVTSQAAPLYRNLEAAIKRRHPEAVVTPILIPYGTDSNAFRPRGVKAFGIFPALPRRMSSPRCTATASTSAWRASARARRSSSRRSAIHWRSNDQMEPQRSLSAQRKKIVISAVSSGRRRGGTPFQS